MPLRIVHDGRLDRPLVVCDYCGEVIADADDGNYQWRFDGRDDYPGAAVYFTHKKCCHPFEQENPGPWGAIELDLLPISMGNNLKLDWRKAERRVQWFDSLG